MLVARAWFFSLLVALVLASGAAVPAEAQARASAAALSPARAAGTDPAPVDLRDDVRVMPGARGTAKWNTTRLYYYETIPSGWDWSLTTAVAKWNQSGGRIKLVRTPYKNRAKLLISYGNTYGSDGFATIGATAHPWVHLSTAYQHKSTTSAYNRVLLVDIFAHELGHVLGFDHVSSACSLMTPVIDITACGLISDTRAGYYKCQVIDRSTVVRFIRLYGGTARYAPGWCLIDPLPQTLSGVVFSGGTSTSSPVQIVWKRPTSYPSGSRVRIQVYDGTSCAASTLRSTTYASLAALTWLDRAADDSGDRCFRVALVNRYGVARSTRTQVLDRWISPPSAPVVASTATWNAGSQSLDFKASVPSGASLVAQWGDDPSVCPAAYSQTAGHQQEVFIEAGTASYYPSNAATCISFFAVKTTAGLASPAITRTWTVPAPTHTPVVGAPTVKTSWAGSYATKVTGVSAGSLAYSVTSGACGPAIPADTWQSAQSTGVTSEYGFYVENAVSCLAFAERDPFDRLGPVTSRTYTVPAPSGTPVVGAPYAYAPWGEGVFAAKVTGVDPGSLGIAVLAGACPASIPTDRWESAYATGDAANEYGFYAPQEGLNCVAFVERDQFGRLGPAAVKKTFTYTPTP